MDLWLSHSRNWVKVEQRQEEDIWYTSYDITQTFANRETIDLPHHYLLSHNHLKVSSTHLKIQLQHHFLVISPLSPQYLQISRMWEVWVKCQVFENEVRMMQINCQSLGGHSSLPYIHPAAVYVASAICQVRG